MRKRKITHITFSDDKGGAAIAAYRLHQAMRDCGLDSCMAVSERRRSEEHIVGLAPMGAATYLNKAKSYILAENLNAITPERGLYSAFCVGSFLRNVPAVMEADCIYLHWINQGTLNARNIEFLLQQNKPVFWFMHDMFPITGGCHHAFQCSGYQRDCSQCPFFPGSSRAHEQLKSKMRLAQYRNLHWIAPSKWLYDCARRSPAVNSRNLHLIPNVISPNFFPMDQAFSRKALRLPQEKRYILFGADGVLTNPYKGLRYFEAVMRGLYALSQNTEKAAQTEVLLFGAGYQREFAEKIPFSVHFMGEIRDEQTMNLLYNAADVMLLTSTAENYPLTVQEALYTGTPVAAFRVGGVPDMIDTLEKGEVIECFDTDQMIQVLERLLSAGHPKTAEVPSGKDDRRKIVREHIELFRQK